MCRVKGMVKRKKKPEEEETFSTQCDFICPHSFLHNTQLLSHYCEIVITFPLNKLNLTAVRRNLLSSFTTC